MLELLRANLKIGPDEIPPEWKTTGGWAKAWKVAACTSMRLVNRGVRDGLIEVKKFRVNENGRVYSTRHFRAVKKS